MSGLLNSKKTGIVILYKAAGIVILYKAACDWLIIKMN